MVAKGKLKVALAAHKGVDYKQNHQKKLVKQARKTKTTKKQEDGWEDVQSENDDLDEDGEESDAEEPLKVS